MLIWLVIFFLLIISLILIYILICKDESNELVQHLKSIIEQYVDELKRVPMQKSSIDHVVSRFEQQINDLVQMTKQGLSKKV